MIDKGALDADACRAFSKTGVLSLPAALSRVMAAAEQYELALLGKHSLTGLTVDRIMRLYVRHDVAEAVLKLRDLSPQTLQYTSLFNVPSGLYLCLSRVRWQSTVNTYDYGLGDTVPGAHFRGDDVKFLFPRIGGDDDLRVTPDFDDPLHERLTAYSKERVRLRAETLLVLALVWEVVTSCSTVSQVALAFPSLAPGVTPRPHSRLPEYIVGSVWVDDLDRALRLANQWLALGEVARSNPIGQYLTTVTPPTVPVRLQHPLIDGWFERIVLKFLDRTKFPLWMV